MVPATSNGIVSREDEKKQFRRYLLYGWGLAFIICVPCRIVRFYILFTSNGDLEIVSRLMVLCFGSVIVLVSFNTVKFISLIWQIYKMSKQRKTLISDVNRHGRQAERNMMFLYFKFFFIMGIFRIPELLLTIYNCTELHIIIVSIIHFMEGLMIFLIFICKRRILHTVNYKLCPSLIIFKAEVHDQAPQMNTLLQQRMIILATTTGSSTIL
ncbi:G-protein coupled receptor Mth2-like isoform X2 [Lycorma delicatula]|uniref:G-protein coupled receptor Mth2-like isoform X2 n=1 Tax=Lycorma delicatula TaxID=130591 RepID=UPI003F515728